MNETSSETPAPSHPSRSFCCPRCGFAQAPATECSRCGVVFAKLRRDSPLRPTLTTESKARTSLAGGLLLAAAAGVAGMLLFPRSRPAPPAAPLPALRREAVVESAQSNPTVEKHVAPPRAQAPPASEAAQLPPPPPEQIPREAKLAPAPFLWYEGATGYRLAMQEATAEGLPLAVYFYTDWCPYCRQLDGEILSKPESLAYFAHVVKVKINPENGPEERAIADRYGVHGYPSFFIQPSATAGARKIQGQTREQGGWVAKAPEAFVADCQTAAGG
jgi:thiol-disulfide isomerase/thioredoxin